MVRTWAYKAIREHRACVFDFWYNSVLNEAINANGAFIEPLPYSEVKATARSIAKYCWKKDAYHYQEFIQRQASKGALGGKKSKGGGRPSLGEPWIELGISRRTWFRKFGTKQA